MSFSIEQNHLPALAWLQMQQQQKANVMGQNANEVQTWIKNSVFFFFC